MHKWIHTVLLRCLHAAFPCVNRRTCKDSCWNICWRLVTHASSVSGSFWANGGERQAKTDCQCTTATISIITVESCQSSLPLFSSSSLWHTVFHELRETTLKVCVANLAKENIISVLWMQWLTEKTVHLTVIMLYIKVHFIIASI